MEKDLSIKVIYIAGNGHSGSTLLDIVIGSGEKCFSAGELTFITRDSITNEYCSCQEKIGECAVWSQVMRLWGEKREISYEEYQRLRIRYERNKASIRTVFNRIRPSASFEKYCLATQQLFQAIKEVTGRSVIVDSSKLPQRIAVLERIVDLRVVHVCRNFQGVLNSSKKNRKKDIRAGVEVDIPPRRTRSVMLDWVFTNLFTEVFCAGVDSLKVRYADYVKDPSVIEQVEPDSINTSREAFYPEHVMAGNTLRLQGQLVLKPKMGFEYKQLNSWQNRLSRSVDRAFWFWH